jgi:hypothetical protein
MAAEQASLMGEKAKVAANVEAQQRNIQGSQVACRSQDGAIPPQDDRQIRETTFAGQQSRKWIARETTFSDRDVNAEIIQFLTATLGLLAGNLAVLPNDQPEPFEAHG